MKSVLVNLSIFWDPKDFPEPRANVISDHLLIPVI